MNQAFYFFTAGVFSGGFHPGGMPLLKTRYTVAIRSTSDAMAVSHAESSGKIMEVAITTMKMRYNDASRIGFRRLIFRSISNSQ